MTDRAKIRNFLVEYADDKMCDYATSRDIKGVILPFIDSMKKEPKFKVGYKVRNKKYKELPICTIESIEDTFFSCDYTNFDISDQDEWEIVKVSTTSVWHDANILPLHSYDVIVEHNNFSTSICRGGQMSRVKGAKWAYIDDLLKL